ncbi:MAG TPA: hypothetical protein VKD72_23780, partial [Gemmataceae bacterium]|nr:hypothetical protein [Gemmataceae bacterium]
MTARADADADADADIVDIGHAIGRDRAAGLAGSGRPWPRQRDVVGKQLVGDSGVSAVLVVDAWRGSGAAQAARHLPRASAWLL